MKICRITRETSCKLRNTNSSPTFPYISAYVNEEKKKKKEKAWGTELMYFVFAEIKGKSNSTRIYLIWTRSARFDGGNFMRSILFKKLNLVLFLGYLFILFYIFITETQDSSGEKVPLGPSTPTGTRRARHTSRQLRKVSKEGSSMSSLNCLCQWPGTHTAQKCCLVVREPPLFQFMPIIWCVWLTFRTKDVKESYLHLLFY